MQKFILLILHAAKLLAADPRMNFLALLGIAGDLRSKEEGELIPTPELFLQYLQQNYTPDVVQDILNSAKILVETLTVETDSEGRQMTFGQLMNAFRVQQWHSSVLGDLPPTCGRPRIILTFEVWDVVGYLHLQIQMQALSIGNFTPVPPAVDL